MQKPEYDLILTCGGAGASQAYESLGARMCASVHHALDPALSYRVHADPRFEADLGFRGGRLPGREARIEEFFLRPASTLPGACTPQSMIRVPQPSVLTVMPSASASATIALHSS